MACIPKSNLSKGFIWPFAYFACQTGVSSNIGIACGSKGRGRTPQPLHLAKVRMITSKASASVLRPASACVGPPLDHDFNSIFGRFARALSLRPLPSLPPSFLNLHSFLKWRCRRVTRQDSTEKEHVDFLRR